MMIGIRVRLDPTESGPEIRDAGSWGSANRWTERSLWGSRRAASRVRSSVTETNRAKAAPGVGSFTQLSEEALGRGADSTISGNTASYNSDDGIQSGPLSMVRQNIVTSNSSYGRELEADAIYRDDVVNANTFGTVFSGIDMGANSCNGATSCP
jgi:hypothetical protein